MSRSSQYPNPKKKYRRRTWEICWNWNKRRYSLYPGRQEERDPAIVADLRRVAALPTTPPPVFPDEWSDSPGVKNYLRDRYQIGTDTEDDTSQKPPDESITRSSCRVARRRRISINDLLRNEFDCVC